MLSRFIVPVAAVSIELVSPVRDAAAAQQDDSLAQHAPAAAIFRGRVIQLADSAPVGRADVWLISVDRHAFTDSTGEFRFDDVPAGPKLIEIRRLGLDVRRDMIVFAPGQEMVRTYALAGRATVLDTVRTTAAGGETYLSPRLRAFEQRRLSGQGGYFISDSVMRRNENSNLGMLGSGLPGVMLRSVYFKSKGGYISALISTRKPCAGLVILHSSECSMRPTCYVAIYLDGVLQYSTKLGIDPPDLAREYPISELAGAEYYAGGAAAPAGMHSDDDGCGSLWLWTRER